MPWASAMTSGSVVAMTESVLTLVEAAKRLGVTVEDVFDLVLRRELGFTQSESGRIFIPAEALAVYERRSRVELGS